MKPRNQRVSCAGSTRPGSGASRKRGGSPAESAATSAREPPHEPGQQVHQARERRQPPKPASPTPRDAEVEPIAERLDAGRIRLQERKRRFRQYQRDVPLEPITQPLALVLDQVFQRAEVEENVVAAQLDREAAQVVGPLIEGATSRELEAGVVPMARQDPVTDRAAVEREAHVRAAIVDGIDLIPVRKQTERVPLNVDDQPSRRAQLGKRRGADERFGGDDSHQLLLHRVTPAA